MNIYIDKLKQLLPFTKYLTTYIDIVTLGRTRASSRASAKKIFGYTEKHHIIPKSFKIGGEKDIENYVFLTAREHFICHKLLVNMTKNTKFYYKSCSAVARFIQTSPTQQRKILSSHDYEFVRKCCSEAKTGENNPNYGKVYTAEERLERSERMTENNPGKNKSEETCKRISESKKGKKMPPRTEEHCKNLSIALKDRLFSIETKKLISESAKNRIKIKCEYCGKIVSVSNYARWHGSNCSVIKQREKIKCEHCGILSSELNYNRWHGNNCSKIKKREKILCEHCNKLVDVIIYNTAHGRNCNVIKPRRTIYCDMCDDYINANNFNRHYNAAHIKNKNK